MVWVWGLCLGVVFAGVVAEDDDCGLSHRIVCLSRFCLFVRLVGCLIAC